MGRMSSPICPNLLSFLGQYNNMIVSLCNNVWFFLLNPGLIVFKKKNCFKNIFWSLYIIIIQ